VLSTTVAIQTCHIRKRDINPPLVSFSALLLDAVSRKPDFFLDLGQCNHWCPEMVSRDRRLAFARIIVRI